MILNMTGKGGGGGTVLISDTLDVNGGTIRTITAKKVVALQTKTITPTSSVQTVNPDTGYDGFSQVTVNAGGSSNDFIITVTYNTTTQKWEPDCTYSEVLAAYQAEKTIVVDAYGDSADAIADGEYDSFFQRLNYWVYQFSNNGIDTVTEWNYRLESNEILTEVSKNNYIIPSGTYSVTSSGTKDVTNYASASIPGGTATGPSSLSGSSATITTGTNTITLTKTGITTTPTVSAGYVSSATASTATVALTASVTVNPTPTASGKTVTIPAGYYSAQTTKDVSTGSATAPSTISGTAASVSTGTNTLTLTKTVSVTPTVSAGYISSGTAGNASVSLTASVTTKAAATITPTTTNQTIASGTYLTGTQTISGDANLVASNIISGISIFGVSGNVVLQNYYTGSSAPSSSLGSNGDLYLQS